MEIATVFLGFFGGPEIILILLVVLIIFGGRKIPELMRGLGKGIKEFKTETQDKEEKEDSSTKS